MTRLRPHLRRKQALLLLGLVVASGVVLDLADDNVSAWFGGHQFATAIFAEALLLGAVYLGFDYLVSQSEARRWHAAAHESLRLIVSDAEAMDRIIEQLISEDRRWVDRSGPRYGQAQKRFEALHRRIETSHALLTASPAMIEFLPVCQEIDDHAARLLQSRAPGAPDDALHVRWYDRAVWRFIGKMTQVVFIQEISEPWLYRIPKRNYLRQLRRAPQSHHQFLRTYLAERNRRGVPEPPPLPGEHSGYHPPID